MKGGCLVCLLLRWVFMSGTKGLKGDGRIIRGKEGGISGD